MQFKAQGPWGTPSPLSTSTASTPVRQLRSGRSSAPLQSARKSVTHFAGESSDDESSSSESGSPFSRLHRPGTPPKPSILRQIRRSSTSQVVPNQPLKPATEVKTKTRRLWDNFELRSSRSEYNLSFVGRDSSTPLGRRLSSANSSKSVWATPAENLLDLSTRTGRVELTRDNCVQAIEELLAMAKICKQLHHDAMSTDNNDLSRLMADGVARAYHNLSAVAKLPNDASQRGRLAPSMMSNDLASLPPESMAAENLLQQFSERLLTMMEQKITNKDKPATPDKV